MKLKLKIFKIKHILTIIVFVIWWFYIHPTKVTGYLKLMLIIPILIALVALVFIVLKYIFTYFEKQKNKN